VGKVKRAKLEENLLEPHGRAVVEVTKYCLSNRILFYASSNSKTDTIVIK
jgi:hypothetical protein